MLCLMFVVKAVKCNTITSEDVLKIVDWTTLLAYKIGKYYSTQKFDTKFIKMCTKKPTFLGFSLFLSGFSVPFHAHQF